MPVVGTQQSPINLVTRDAIRVPPDYGVLRIHYTGPLVGSYRDENFVVADPQPSDSPSASGAPGTTITVGDKTWVLRKIHIHRPAEHRVDGGGPAPYECHLLHSLPGDPGASGPKLVIGTFFDIRQGGKSQARRDRSASAADQGPDDESAEAASGLPRVDPRAFLPPKKAQNRWYRYEGSLTSPPYTEDVTWIVLETHVLVPADQVAGLQAAAQQCARHVYPLDRRYVLKSFD